MRILKKSILEYIYPTCPNRASVWIYRLAHKLHFWGVPEIPFMLYLLNFFINGCEIHYRAQIGKNFVVNHSRGVVIGKHAVIGESVKVYSGVVIGQNKKNGGMPKIGNNIIVGSGAKVLGSIFVADGTSIGANAVVIKDTEPNSTMVGVPAIRI